MIVPVVDWRVVIVPDVAFKLLIVALEALKTDVFILERNVLFIKAFTQAVVGILEELSESDKKGVIMGCDLNVVTPLRLVVE